MSPVLTEKKQNLVESYHFTHNGINILLNVNTSDFFSVNKIHIDLIDELQKTGSFKDLLSMHSRNEIEKAFNELVENHFIVSEIPEYKKLSVSQDKEVINLVMNISQDCNLRCRYCFASTGSYKGERSLMSKDVAERALRWFVSQAKQSKALNLHLFGGEPLMNIPLVKYIVSLCKELETQAGKTIYINICTNGTIINDELIDLIKQNKIGLQISIDGPKEIHDKFRPTADNGSSYDIIISNLTKMFAELDKNQIIPRATIPRGYTNVNKVVHHIIDDLGFHAVFFIPAMGCGGYTYSEQDMPQLLKEYDKLADTFIDRIRMHKEYNVYPLVSEIDAVGKGIRRIYGCGAGIGFASVDIKGDIYPCMRFTNNKDFVIGNIFSGFNENRNKLFDRTIYNREKCATCWARHLCGGACIAIPVENHKGLKSFNDITCDVSKHIAELAMYINTVILNEGLKFDKNQLQTTDFMRRRFQ